MPLSAHADQTFEAPARVPLAPGVARTRRAAASALAVLAVAASAAGCAATSSGSPAAGSATPASTSAASAGTGSTANAAGSASSSAAASPAPAASCAGSGASATATTPPGSGSGSGQAPALAAIEFVDSAHGWVAGAGRIMATSDGGGSWTRQYAGQADLNQVDFVDGQHGWAAGGGTLLRTADGGATWTPLAEPCQGELSSLHFVSPVVGYAVAAAAAPADSPSPGGPYTTATGGTLLRTGDGGATWSAVTTAPANPQSACFTNADDGYLGTPGRIWRTTDGGGHWTLALTEPASSGNPTTPADTPEIQCAGATGLWALFLGQGAATGHAPYLAYASQDGRQWHGVLEEQFTETALRPGVKLPEGPGSYPGPVSAIDPGTAVFVGYTPPIGYGVAPVMLASDNGYTLSKEGDVGTINEPLAAAFLSLDQGWVVGENLKTNAFSVEATSDAGRSWTTQYTVG
jgi:photosystem II stability/assembly factor-like uncharacterized protein